MQAERTVAWVTEARTSHRSVDAGFLAADRNKRVAAGVLAGGVAYRFFFWMLAVSLLGNGALGFIDAQDVQARPRRSRASIPPSSTRSRPANRRARVVGGW